MMARRRPQAGVNGAFAAASTTFGAEGSKGLDGKLRRIRIILRLFVCERGLYCRLGLQVPPKQHCSSMFANRTAFDVIEAIARLDRCLQASRCRAK